MFLGIFHAVGLGRFFRVDKCYSLPSSFGYLFMSEFSANSTMMSTLTIHCRKMRGEGEDWPHTLIC